MRLPSSSWHGDGDGARDKGCCCSCSGRKQKVNEAGVGRHSPPGLFTPPTVTSRGGGTAR